MQATADTLDAGALFETHRDRIYRYVLHLVHDRADAEDLTQETFLRAHRFRGSIRDAGAVRSWLYQIATHVCLDRLRQHKRQLSLDREEGAQRAESIASASPSALEAAERKETSQCVQRCLQFLPDHYRAVILMHEVYSLTAAEIASLLAVNLTTVKMRLHRARRMLEMVMECGCAVTNDACGLPVCQPKPGVLPHSGNRCVNRSLSRIHADVWANAATTKIDAITSEPPTPSEGAVKRRFLTQSATTQSTMLCL